MGRRIITTENLEEDAKIENHLRPQFLSDLHRTGKSEEDAGSLYPGGKRKRRGVRPCIVLWTAGTRKDDACRNHRQ